MPELKLDLNQEQNNNKEVQEKAKKEAQEKAKKEAQEKAKKDKDFEIEIKADTANTEMTSQKVQKEKGAGKVEKVAEKVNKIDEKLPEQAVANSEEAKLSESDTIKNEEIKSEQELEENAKTEQANEEFEDSKYEEVEDYDEESEENEALEHDLIRDVPEIDRDLFILAGAIKDLSDEDNLLNEFAGVFKKGIDFNTINKDNLDNLVEILNDISADLYEYSKDFQKLGYNNIKNYDSISSLLDSIIRYYDSGISNEHYEEINAKLFMVYSMLEENFYSFKGSDATVNQLKDIGISVDNFDENACRKKLQNMSREERNEVIRYCRELWLRQEKDTDPDIYFNIIDLVMQVNKENARADLNEISKSVKEAQDKFFEAKSNFNGVDDTKLDEAYKLYRSLLMQQGNIIFGLINNSSEINNFISGIYAAVKDVDKMYLDTKENIENAKKNIEEANKMKEELEKNKKEAIDEEKETKMRYAEKSANFYEEEINKDYARYANKEITLEEFLSQNQSKYEKAIRNYQEAEANGSQTAKAKADNLKYFFEDWLVKAAEARNVAEKEADASAIDEEINKDYARYANKEITLEEFLQQNQSKYEEAIKNYNEAEANGSKTAKAKADNLKYFFEDWLGKAAEEEAERDAIGELEKIDKENYEIVKKYPKRR